MFTKGVITVPRKNRRAGRVLMCVVGALLVAAVAGGGQARSLTNKAVETGNTKIGKVALADLTASAVEGTQAGGFTLDLKKAASCRLTVQTFKLAAISGGWRASVKVTGAAGGWAVWTVIGTNVTATNTLAKKIQTGCPASTPPPPAAKALAGHYTGTSSAGKAISFDVTADQNSATNLSAGGSVSCTDGSSWTWGISSTSLNPIDSRLNFSRSYIGALTSSDPSVTNILVNYTFTAGLTTTGTASGAFQIATVSWDQNGTHYNCTGTSASWTANRG